MRNGHTYKEADSKHRKAQRKRFSHLDFDQLSALATDNPEAFERYREKLYQQAIDKAPTELQRRLKGMQFKINMAREYSKNSLSSCMKLSNMMQESLAELSRAIANPQEYLRKQDNSRLDSAEIIPLFPNR